MPFEPTKRNFNELFDSTRSAFEIPFFQRAYSWEYEQLKTFFDDLIHHKNLKREFFIGSILTTHEYHTNNIKVIDGQQRITTCLLFSLALLKIFYEKKQEESLTDDIGGLAQTGRNINNPPVSIDSLTDRFNQILAQIFPPNRTIGNGNFNFVLNPSKNDMFEWNEIFQEEFIANNENINPQAMQDASAKIGSGKLLASFHDAQNFIKEKGSLVEGLNLQPIDYLRRLIDTCDFLWENFKFAEIRLFPDADIEDIFRKLNTEGKELDDFDIIRTYLWMKIEENDRKSFIDNWGKFEALLTLPWSDWDDQPDKPRTIRRTNHIKNFWVPYSKTISPNFKTSNLAKELNNAWGNSELMNADVSTPIRKANKAISDMRQYIPIYNCITERLRTPSSDYLNNENQVRHHKLLEAKLMQMFFWDPGSAALPYIFKSASFYMSDECSEDQKRDILKTYDIIESFMIRRYVLGVTESTKETLHIMFETIMNDYDGDFKVFRSLLVDERVKFYSDEDIESSLRDTSYAKPSQRKFIKFLLIEYEVDGLTDEDKRTLYGDFAGDEYIVNIDHFMPQNPEKWKSDLLAFGWNNLFYENENGEEVIKNQLYESKCNNLGNLMLLSSQANRSKRNKNFIESKKIVLDQNFLRKSRDELMNKDSWTEDDIDSRMNAIIDFFKQRFKTFDDLKEYGDKKISEFQRLNKQGSDQEAFEKAQQFENKAYWIYEGTSGNKICTPEFKELISDIGRGLPETSWRTISFNIWSGQEIILDNILKVRRVGRDHPNFEWNADIMMEHFFTGNKICFVQHLTPETDSELQVLNVSDSLALDKLERSYFPERFEDE